MVDHELLSIQQLRQVQEDVAELTDHAEKITKHMLSAYGPDDPRVVRAQEIRAAIQRLQWAIERQPKIMSVSA